MSLQNLQHQPLQHLGLQQPFLERANLDNSMYQLNAPIDGGIIIIVVWKFHVIALTPAHDSYSFRIPLPTYTKIVPTVQLGLINQLDCSLVQLFKRSVKRLQFFAHRLLGLEE